MGRRRAPRAACTCPAHTTRLLHGRPNAPTHNEGGMPFVKDVQLRPSHALGSSLLLGAYALLLAVPVLAEEFTSDAPPDEASHVVQGTGFAGLALRAGPGDDYPRLG